MYHTGKNPEVWNHFQWGCGDIETPIYCWWEGRLKIRVESNLAIPITNAFNAFDLAIPLIGVYLINMLMYVNETHERLSIDCNSKILETTQVPSIGSCLLNEIHTQEGTLWKWRGKLCVRANNKVQNKVGVKKARWDGLALVSSGSQGKWKSAFAEICKK